jgi:predicted hydrocarbon binding protein
MSEDLYSAKVPEPLKPVFLAAQQKMEQMFGNIDRKPADGKILLDNARYVMIRAESLATGIISEASKLLGEDAASMFLYNFANAIGKREAREFHAKFNLQDPVEKLSAGPVYFAFVGLAFVDIFKESAPAPNEDYFLIYEHPNTFESEVYKTEGRSATEPVCHFSAGYSAGWCSESFGLDLEAKEISCVAKGDKSCRFIMAPYSRIMSHMEKVDEYLAIDH